MERMNADEFFRAINSNPRNLRHFFVDSFMCGKMARMSSRLVRTLAPVAHAKLPAEQPDVFIHRPSRAGNCTHAR
jgi:hypothetical protein